MEGTQPEPLYPLLYTASAPPLVVDDVFEKRYITLREANEFCTDILELLTQRPPSTPTNYISYSETTTVDGTPTGLTITKTKKKKKKTITPPSLPTQTIVYTPPPPQTVIVTSPSPVIVSNAQPIEVISKGKKKKKTTKKEEGEEKKKEDDGAITLAQIAIASTMLATSLPIAAYYLSRDYNKYSLYNRIDNKFSKFKKIIQSSEWKNESHLAKGTLRVAQFLDIVDMWECIRLSIWKDISGNVKVKMGGGFSVLGMGLALVFSSGLGFAASALIGGVSWAGSIWKQQTTTRKTPNDLSKVCTNYLSQHPLA